MIHLGVNKIISNKKEIETYFTSMETQKELHYYCKSFNLEGLYKESAK